MPRTLAPRAGLWNSQQGFGSGGGMVTVDFRAIRKAVGIPEGLFSLGWPLYVLVTRLIRLID